MTMRIALDAMGGDFAPEINVDGAIEALNADPQIEIVLVGDQPRLEALLTERGYSGNRLTIRHADGFVGMDEKPMDALRRKPNCSIIVCWQLMANKEVDAVVSAGHTGAVVAAGLRTRLFLSGVKRPGIAVAMPTLKGRSVLMDVGANPGAKPEHLFQYAVMGSIYAKYGLGMNEARMGLINIGSEDGKGTELGLETHGLITKSPLKSSYIGNVEGRGIFQGEAEVIICEGFLGNVLLKASEGMADMMFRRVAGEILPALSGEREKAASALDQLGKKYQYSEVGGAPLLGVEGICLICHGSSKARSIRNACLGALHFHKQKLNERIREELAESGG